MVESFFFVVTDNASHVVPILINLLESKQVGYGDIVDEFTSFGMR